MKRLTLALGIFAALGAHGADRTVTTSWYDRANNRAASWYYPVPCRLKLTHGTNSCIVLCDDRGPNKRLLTTRQLDVSPDVFTKLGGDLHNGLLHDVQVHVLPVN